MGYRSDCYLLLGKTVADEVRKSVLLDSTKLPKMILESIKEHDYDPLEDGSMYITWVGYKWYESYPEIAEVERFLTELRSREYEDDSELYCFIRLGEEDDDTHQEGALDEIYVSRSVEFY